MFSLKRSIVSLLILLFACGSGLLATEHTKDSLKTVKANLTKKKAILIDVREKQEWDAGHLQDARLVPLSKLRKIKTITKKLAKELPKDKIIYCHCRSGGRVLVATEILKKYGYDIRPLKKGYADLLKAGFLQAKKVTPKKKDS